LETICVYRDEVLVDSIKSIVIRDYDKNKLIEKKNFTLKKDGSKILENATINSYDLKGNLILQIDSMKGNNFSKTFYEYDLNMRKSRSLVIFKLGEDNLNDTSIGLYKYDSDGKLIELSVQQPKGVFQFKTINQYRNGQKFFSFTINSKNDTVQKSKFEREGNLTKEIKISGLDAVDTVWRQGDKILKTISLMNKPIQRKRLLLKKYNEKGDETESVSFH
jgi:hypothetical protein